MRHLTTRLATWLLIAAGLVAPQLGHAASPAAPEGTPPVAVQAAGVPADYLIGPGDVLQVFVWRNADLSVTVAVRPDGKISTPLVEDMVAVGKTPTQLARDIEKVLSEYVRQPTVNVIVGTAVSAYRQVKVVGQVKTPQSVPYRDGLRVLDVILVVGGVTDYAAPNRAKVVRVDGDKQTAIRVRLGDLLRTGDMRQNILLQPGDVLIVPESLF